MSGKQEKRKRREEGISTAAKRDQSEFARLAIRARDAGEDRRYRARNRKRKVGAGVALALVAAATAALAIL